MLMFVFYTCHCILLSDSLFRIARCLDNKNAGMCNFREQAHISYQVVVEMCNMPQQEMK